MTFKYSLQEARMHFNKIVRQAMDGHEVIVVKRTPRGSTEILLARIVPYTEGENK